MIAGIHKNLFYQYVEIVYGYSPQGIIKNSDKALNTNYYTAELHYMSGLAYELFYYGYIFF